MLLEVLTELSTICTPFTV